MSPRVAQDGEAIAVFVNGEEWRSAWSPPGPAPDGVAHGACGFCVTPVGTVLLISHDGLRWEWPGGRPEPGESWEDTFRREMCEETGCTVGEARLLGFCRSACLTGPEAGLVLVRSVWRGEVELAPWSPQHEIVHRREVVAADLLSAMDVGPGWAPILRRAAAEAGLVAGD
ncbi:MAG: NUDIX domain-containing protein [Proteobacteria bacterium]|nr:NUDIX domain-containing protein [Pseudomonadota bacterium]